MARRTTRNKVLWQMKQVEKLLDMILWHLAKADDVSLESHPVLQQRLPSLVVAVDELKKIFIELHAEL